MIHVRSLLEAGWYKADITSIEERISKRDIPYTLLRCALKEHDRTVFAVITESGEYHAPVLPCAYQTFKQLPLPIAVEVKVQCRTAFEYAQNYVAKIRL